MKRTNLVNAIRAAAENLGYNFYSGHEAAIPATVSSPAIWLSAPQLKSTSGINERKDSYEVSMFVIRHLDSTQQLESLSANMEADADTILSSLNSLDFVRKISKTKSKPHPKPLSINTDIAITVDTEIELSYYNYI